MLDIGYKNLETMQYTVANNFTTSQIKYYYIIYIYRPQIWSRPKKIEADKFNADIFLIKYIFCKKQYE